MRCSGINNRLATTNRRFINNLGTALNKSFDDIKDLLIVLYKGQTWRK